MPNIMGSLYAKRSSLMAEAARLREDTTKRISEIEQEILQIDSEIKVYDKLYDSYACDACGGSGEVHTVGGDGNPTVHICERCGGSGLCMSGKKRNET